MATSDYGLAHLKIVPAIITGETAGSYPDFETLTGGFCVTAIVKDSFSYNESAPSKTNIEIEDSDDIYATIKTDAGTKGFTLQTYDMSEDAYKYLCGYIKGEGSNAWMEEGVTFELPAQAVEIKTKKLDSFPAKIYQWAKMDISVTRMGTIGKSGLPNFQLEFVKLANYDKDGKEISGARWKNVTA